jgi:hypothetical protein
MLDGLVSTHCNVFAKENTLAYFDGRRKSFIVSVPCQRLDFNVGESARPVDVDGDNVGNFFKKSFAY